MNGIRMTAPKGEMSTSWRRGRYVRRRLLRWSALPLTILALVVVGLIPLTTRQGVDYVVSEHRLPVYLKALEFIDRDANYRALAATVTKGAATDEARALAVFDWTRANVRDAPPGLPIVDDHVWHIVIRGYGVEDQQADVFTTLATYAGVPAYFLYVERAAVRLPVSFTRIEGRWRVFDVHHGLVFRTPGGALLTVEELAANPAIVVKAADGLVYRGIRYADMFAAFRAPGPPPILRAEMQMVWPRLWYEAKRAVGLGGRAWSPLPDGTAR